MKSDIEIVSETSDYVRSFFHGDVSGHDWWHTHRVWEVSKLINTKEKGNSFIVEMAALLHDVDDQKLQKNSDVKSCNAATWLAEFEIEKDVVTHIINIIDNISFKGAGQINKISTIEGMIVQDADSLML